EQRATLSAWTKTGARTEPTAGRKDPEHPLDAGRITGTGGETPACPRRQLLKEPLEAFVRAIVLDSNVASLIFK
ncbi:hypothetical protein KI387_018554, partial [Taxus chinensis]